MAKRTLFGKSMSRKMWLAGAIAALVPLASRADVDKKAERLWKTKCASCHGADGKGQTGQGKAMGIADMSSAAWQGAHTDAQVKSAIESGVPGKMDGFKSSLSGEQIDSLVAFLRTLKA